MSHKGAKSGDKIESWWSSIAKEKLDTLRWVLLHSGINTARLQNDEGLTGLQVAAMGDRAKAILVILDVLRQKRELAEAIDVPDDAGRTPLMLAAAAGAAKSVDHLLYYGASQTARSEEGLTAREYAVKGKRTAVLEVIDEHNDAGKDDGGAGDAAEAVDADGLTSTQRSRLKKKQMRVGERKGTLAAVTAALAASSLGADGTSPPDEAAGDSASTAPNAQGVPPLPALAQGPPRWAEVGTVLAERRRELCVVRTAAAGASQASAEADVDSSVGIDPAVWHCTLLQRLELRLPPPLIGGLPPLVGHLVHLTTLIIAGAGLTELPEALVACTELRFIDVSRNALTALPAAIGRLPRLEVLNIADNSISDISPLAPVTSLLTFTADRNALTDISSLNFAGLARLETLSLTGNRLAGLPDEVGAQIEENDGVVLRIAGYVLVIESPARHVSILPCLRLPQIGALQQLAVLNVAGNEIEELPAGMAELKEKKIRELRLLPNPITDKKVCACRVRWGRGVVRYANEFTRFLTVASPQVLKILQNQDRAEKVVKELFKHLATGVKGSKGGKRQ